jgi:hypothetical protein
VERNSGHGLSPDHAWSHASTARELDLITRKSRVQIRDREQRLVDARSKRLKAFRRAKRVSTFDQIHRAGGRRPPDVGAWVGAIAPLWRWMQAKS